MKKYIFIFIILLAASACGQISDVTDYIMFFGKVADSSGWTNYTPDSVRVMGFHNGAECHDAWYNLSDAQADTLNGGLVFFDQIQDLDNDAGDGYYLFVADYFYKTDSLYQRQTQQRYVISGISTLLAWTPRLDNDSLIIDQSTLTALKPTTPGRTLDVATTGEGGVDFSNILGTLDSNEVSLGLVLKMSDSLLSVINELKKVDTVLWLLGLKHTARSITKYYNDVDTLFIRSGSDTLKFVVYYHTGGTPGAAPDSTRCYDY